MILDIDLNNGLTKVELVSALQKELNAPVVKCVEALRLYAWDLAAARSAMTAIKPRVNYAEWRRSVSDDGFDWKPARCVR